MNTHLKRTVNNTIDDVVNARQDQLHFKGTADDVRKAMYKVIDFATMKPGERLSTLNHNSSYEKAADFVFSYMEENPEEKTGLPSSIDNKIDVPVNETLGLDSDYYMQLCNTLKENGLVSQKGGALNMVMDTVMEQLEDVVTLGCYVHTSSNRKKTETARRLAVEMGLVDPSDVPSDTREGMWDEAQQKAQLVKEFLPAFGTSIEKIQGAYEEGGLKGTTEHFISTALHTFEDTIDQYVLLANEMGVNLTVRGEDIADAYDEKGFSGHEGVVDQVVLSALGSLDEAHQSYIPMGVQAAVALPAALRRTTEYINEQGSNNVGPDEAKQKIIGDVLAHTMMASMTENNDAVTKDKLQTITRENGVFGDEGLLDYLAEETYKKGMRQAEGETVGEQDVRSIYNAFKTLKSLDEPGATSTESEKINVMTRYAADLDSKAQEHGVSPETILSDDAYVNERKELFKNMKKSTEAYQSEVQKNHQKTREGMEKWQSVREEITRESLDETLQDHRPQNSFLASVYDALTTPLRKRTAPERISDYITIMEGVTEGMYSQFESELARYTSS